MRSHKYIKRTGTPGNYQYWYKLPDGRVVAGNDAQQKQGRIEHAKRLLAGRRDGVHSMSHDEIARETGHDAAKVRSMDSNLTRDQRLRGRAHDFEEHHLKEAKLNPSHPAYGEHLAQHSGGEGSAPSAPSSGAPQARAAQSAPAAAEGSSGAADTPPVSRPRRSRGVDRGRGLEPEGEGDSGRQSSPTPGAAPAAPNDPRRQPGGDIFQSDSVEGASLRVAHRRAQRAGDHPEEEAAHRQMDEQRTGQRTLTGQPVPAAAQPSAPAGGSASAAAPATGSGAPSADELRRKLAEQHGVNLGGGSSRASASTTNSSQTSSSSQVANPGAGGRQPPEGWNSTGSHIRRDVGDTHHQIGAATAQEGGRGKSVLTISHGGQEIHRSQHDTVEGAVHASKVHEQRHAQAAQQDAAQRHAATQPAAPAAGAEPTHHPDAAPGTPHARELSQHDPDFGASERHLEHQAETQRSGGNPYLDRASEIFHRIQGDVKEPRRGTVKNILASMHALKTGGQPLTEENLKTHYKQATGSNLTKADLSHFEAATFHTPEEVMENKPLNAETERMKRGFAAKQFARLKPFLGAEFKSRHPDAPPPYPTYNDLKGWDEHARDGGGSRPEWAGGEGRGGQKRAMPKEFFDSMPKNTDGKPMMPPGWMPLHLAPVWSYVARSMAGKTDSAGRPAAYAHANLNEQDLRSYGLPTHDNQKVRMHAQSPNREEVSSGARKPEEMLLNSLRKYVQMRGGADQLVDIPSSKVGKLQENGVSLTHADLFKADEELSDQALQKIMTTKVIDPVGLMAVVKREMKGGGDKVKKSILLVVDQDAPFFPGETIRKSRKQDEAYEIDVVKSEQITRIKRILDERSRA